MKVVSDLSALRGFLEPLREKGQRIAFVPTMGNLHSGHLRLVARAKKLADKVVVSIFVNPMQFGAGEDFDNYPRTPKDDKAALQALDVDFLFMPEVETMYPRPLPETTFVEVPGLGDILCGAHRPGHFRGVATVVNRLFNLVQPDVAVFGKKDYQQLAIIRRMAEDLAMPVEVVGVETVREADNLAMSSRNRYLSATERKTAPTLYATLDSIRSLIISVGEIPLDIEQQAMTRLKSAGFNPDYVSIRRQLDLAVATPEDARLVILAAAWLGKTRLIDNLEFELNPEA